MARIASLYRYPVKGLSPEPVAEAQLTAGGHFPHDRLYAIENGPSGFTPERPVHKPKTCFLMLMRNETLARLSTRFDEAQKELRIESPDGSVAQFALETAEGRKALESFFGLYSAGELKGPPRLLASPPGYRFMDSGRSGFVSLLNLASVEELATKAGAGLDPLRFRANVHLDGLDAWQEMKWVGKTIRVGAATLEVLKPIDRCLATHVDPQTGERDVDVTGALRRSFGHINCGIYAKIVRSGLIRPGDTAAPEPDLFD